MIKLKPLPYFKWYPADAETDANFRAMDDADLGFYMRCLNHCWINGGIPADPKERARVLRTRVDTANKRWERVGKCFTKSPTHEQLLVNSRQESERELAMSKSVKCSESVKVRYERNTNELPRALARTVYECVSVSSSETTKKKTSIASSRFPEFWEKYPLKNGENLCAGVWTGIVTVEMEGPLFACLDRYLKSDQVYRGVVMKPNNWLHDCSRDGWRSDWPKVHVNGNGTPEPSRCHKPVEPDWMREDD